MEYKIKEPEYPANTGCGNASTCATKEIMQSSEMQNKINNLVGGSSKIETEPIIPNVVGASEHQNKIYSKLAELSVTTQENSKFDKHIGMEPLKGGKNTRRKTNRKKSLKKNRKTKTKKFKKHYMWNTKGKRYMAKTHKQHLRGVKLGHTHKKPKKSKRRTKKRGGSGKGDGNKSRPKTPESTPVNSSSSTAPIVPVLARVDSNNNPLPHAHAEVVEKEQKEKQRNRVSKVMGPSGEENRWEMVERTRPSIVRRWVDENGFNSDGEYEGVGG